MMKKIKEFVKKTKIPFVVSFLFCFMWLIFGPAEIFFANVVEFEFIYQEFAFYLIVFAVIISLIMAVVGAILPEKIRRIYLSLVFGCSLAGYLQVMFFNQGLDLLGLNPDGYHVELIPSVINALIWIAIIAGVMCLSFWKTELWKKGIVYLSVILLLVQGVAYLSLLVTAKDEAYHYPEAALHISGEKQFQVSADQNVIVIVLDCFSNEYIDAMNTVYPGATDFLSDFTYYNNTDCNYYGTYPSLAHMFTGCEVDMQVSMNDWFNEIWNNDKVNSFYQMLHDKKYLVHFYTPDNVILSGENGLAMLTDKIDNISDENLEYNVHNTLLLKVMMKMSAYRMLPEFLKPLCYTLGGEYADIVRIQNRELEVTHHQANFYAGLTRNGLTVDSEYNYFIVQHFMGTHEYTTDENGGYHEECSVEETAKGCMVILEAYLNELKRLQVYDDATIIITSDHGWWGEEPQVLFYIKQAGEEHEQLTINNAPISHCELLPTLAEAVGEDASMYGNTIYDFDESSERERIFWVKTYDTGTFEWRGYYYTGDRDVLKEKVKQGPDICVPMIDGFY